MRLWQHIRLRETVHHRIDGAFRPCMGIREARGRTGELWIGEMIDCAGTPVPRAIDGEGADGGTADAI